MATTTGEATKEKASTDPGETHAALVPGEIASHASCLLVKLGQVAYRLQEVRLAELDLRVRHFSVLQGLADEGPIGQLDLGQHLRIDPATMAAVLDHLEKRDAVSRQRSRQDKRRYIVALTPTGKELLRQATQILDTIDGLLDTDLEDGQANALREGLTQLAKSPALIDSFTQAGDVPRRR